MDLEESNNKQIDQQKQLELINQLEIMIRQLLEPDAKARLNNIKLVNPDLYFKVAQFIVQLYQAGQLRGKVNDNTLKELLHRLQPKREFKIVRK